MLNVGIRYVDGWLEMTGGWLNLNMVQILSSHELLRWAFIYMDVTGFLPLSPPNQTKGSSLNFYYANVIKGLYETLKRFPFYIEEFHFSKANLKWILILVNFHGFWAPKVWEVAKWAVPFFFINEIAPDWKTTLTSFSHSRCCEKTCLTSS